MNAIFKNGLQKIRMHMIGFDADPIESHIARIRGVFGERLISLPAKEDGNLIVMGFRTEPRAWDGARATLRSPGLARRRRQRPQPSPAE